MEKNNLVFSTVAILVCVVMIGCCLVPIVQDSIVGKQVTKTVTYTNEISGTRSVYQLASGDSITVDLSGYTVNAGGIDYTTTSDIMLVDPDDGLVIPDYTNIAVKLYEADGITEIASDFTKVIGVHCSFATTLVYTSDGKVFLCGRGGNGQQSNQSTSNVDVFTDRTPAGEKVIFGFVSTGDSWIVTESGKVFGCGNGGTGQQSNQSTSNVDVFTDRTPAGEKVTAVSCTNYATWIVTESGKVFGCGAGDDGQQSNQGSSSVDVFTDRTPAGEKVTAVTCSQYTTWIVTESGKVFGCGRGTNGQQASGENANIREFTDRTPAGEKVTAVSCSNETTWIVTESGKVFGCGSGTYGQQSNQSTSSVNVFTDRTPAGEKVTAVNCSYETTWIVTESGKVFGCGHGNNGQQSNQSTSDVNELTNREIGTAPIPTVITYTGTDLTIKDIVIESQPTIYLISSIAALDTAGLIYIDSTDTPAEYYADPSSVLSFSAAADSYYVGKGAEILSSYDSSSELQTNKGTATQVSTIYTYSEAFPITASGVTGYSMLIDDSYTGTYTEREGAIDNDLWVILATLTVTLTIIGVVIGAVRMIGGRE